MTLKLGEEILWLSEDDVKDLFTMEDALSAMGMTSEMFVEQTWTILDPLLTPGLRKRNLPPLENFCTREL